MLLSSISFSVSHTTVHCPCQWYFMGGDSAWDHINCCPRHSANWFTAHEHVLQALERICQAAGYATNGMRKRLRLMRCVLRTVRNDAHPRTFRTLADLDYRDTPRLDCRDAPPPRMLWRVTCASPTLMCLCLCSCLLSRTANVRARA